MNGTGFIKRDSIIHRLNPSLKFIAFIVLIAMIFLPLGFFAQMLIGVVVLAIYFAAKLPKKMMWNIIKSVLFLFALLLLINWCIYKDPIAVMLPNNYFGITVGNLEKMPMLSLNAGSSIMLPNSTTLTPFGEAYVSNLWGGTVIGFIPTNDPAFLNKVIEQNLGIDAEKVEKSLNSLYNNISSTSRTDLLKLFNGDEGLAKRYLWVINNRFVLDGVKYTPTILNHANNGFMINSVVYSQTSWSTLSPKAIQLALYVSIKVYLMIVVATILTSTTTSIELTYALEDILSPLKIFRFPVAEASMMIAIALRFIPSLLSESQRVLNAQSSRGVDFKNGNFIDKCKAIVSLVVPLFSIAFQKAGELANAMDARSYNPRYARTRYRIFKLTIFDWFAFALLCILFGFLIGIMIVKLNFTPFGIFELGVLLG